MAKLSMTDKSLFCNITSSENVLEVYVGDKAIQKLVVPCYGRIDIEYYPASSGRLKSKDTLCLILDSGEIILVESHESVLLYSLNLLFGKLNGNRQLFSGEGAHEFLLQNITYYLAKYSQHTGDYSLLTRYKLIQNFSPCIDEIREILFFCSTNGVPLDSDSYRKYQNARKLDDMFSPLNRN